MGEINGWRFRGFITTKFSITENEKHPSEREKDEVDFDCKISKCGSSIVVFETFAIKHTHTHTNTHSGVELYVEIKRMLLIGIKKRCHVQLKNSLKAHKNLFPPPSLSTFSSHLEAANEKKERENLMVRLIDI